ncbi:MAG: hypothetical protein R3A12_02775 [Ignavibacteria bacterium]
MRIAITFNIKKEKENLVTIKEELSPKKDFSKYLNENLISNYPERLDDTYAEWDCEETIDASQICTGSRGHDVTLIEADRMLTKS